MMQTEIELVPRGPETDDYDPEVILQYNPERRRGGRGSGGHGRACAGQDMAEDAREVWSP